MDANNADIERIGLKNIRYICDDGCNVLNHFDLESQDLLASCPPYFDLEVYSDDARDASNQGSYDEFIKIMEKSYTDAIKCLKNDRFAVIVIGDVRGKDGSYVDFSSDLKRIFKNGGMKLLNELILVEPCGAAAVRAGLSMDARKVTKTHQNVFVFYKGDPRNVKKVFPKIDFSDVLPTE